jgi:DNA repair exonuclease SbcCD ATPase subunit
VSDIKELNNELLEVRQGLEQCDRLTRERDRANNRLEKEKQELSRLEAQQKAEGEDVQRLEGLSLTGLFYAVLGKKDERLEVERRELLAAHMKYESRLRLVTSLENDIADLNKQLARFSSLPRRYAALLARKERMLPYVDPDAAAQMDAAVADLARIRNLEQELREALEAGKQAQTALNQAVDALENAQGWGTFDLLGGGLITSVIKQGVLNDAGTAVREAQPLLQRFERELKDVDEQIGLQVDTDGLTAFVDIFFDNLLVDLVVQFRINDSLDAITKIMERLRALLTRLEKKQEELGRESQRLEKHRRSLLEKN